MNILVTGGTGYVGSHTCVALLEAGHQVTVLDNLHPADLQRALAPGIDAVIHFAAPNKIRGTIALLQAMRGAGVDTLVFSSSATVYGEPDAVPVTEDAPLRVTNPYGRTKLVMEDLIRDACQADPVMSAVLLRYFNPVGAHPSGRIGEDPAGIPNNLMPYVAQVAVGRRERLQVFGDDYPTPDGTGVRDYIHVMDLAQAHVRALAYGQAHTGARAINVGTGRGYSVLELVRAFEKASGKAVPLDIVERRVGDVAELWAEPGLAGELLGWRAEKGLLAMCEDAWRWQAENPVGYS